MIFGQQEANDFNDFEQDFYTEEEIQTGQYKPLTDEVIFLINLTEDIFVKGDDDRIGIEETLKGFSSFLKSKIISSNKDKIGLAFYGSQKTNNPLNFKGIDIAVQLDFPSAEKIKFANSLLQGFKDIKMMESETPLYEALWACNHMFKNFGSEDSTKRIFLFTSSDNPNSKNIEAQTQALHHAEQLANQGIEIELFPLRINNKTFDYNIFFKRFITFDFDEINNEIVNPNDKLSSLAIRLRRKEFKKRMLGMVDFTLGSGVIVGTKFFSIVNKFKKPSGMKLDVRTSKPLKVLTQYSCGETGKNLFENQIGTYFPLGGEKVEFTKDEVDRIKNFGDPSLVLLGFKPLDWVKPYYNNRSSYFIYPNNERVGNSDKFFDALISALSKKKQVAIVRFIPKRNSRMRFGALIPQKEKFDEEGYQTPPGLNLVFLPYADDLRDLNNVPKMDMTSATTPKRHHIIAAKRMINAMTIDFDSKSFENPEIQNLYSHIQTIALDEAQPEEVEDYLQPDREGLKSLDPLIRAFKNCVFGENGYLEPEERLKIVKSLMKRERASKSAKKKKPSKDNGMDIEAENGMTADEMREIEEKVKDGTANKLTKKKIVRFLKAKGLTSTGTKAELISKMAKKLKL